MVQAMLITADRMWTRRKKKNLADGYNAVVPTYLGFCNFVTCGNNCSKILRGKFQK